MQTSRRTCASVWTSKISAGAARACAIAAILGVTVTVRTANAAGTLDHAPYGTTRDGQAVEIYTMTNDHGLRVRFLSYGGVITEIDVPDRTGRIDNIALGLRTLQEYETLPGHFGAITGRYANRIGGAQFTLNGQTYHLIADNGPNTLHGGPDALDHRVWTVSPLTVPDAVAATLRYVSPDGDQNFPGTLTTEVTYTLTKDDILQIVYVVAPPYMPSMASEAAVLTPTKGPVNVVRRCSRAWGPQSDATGHLCRAEGFDAQNPDDPLWPIGSPVSLCAIR